ncbi:MAG: hypothetical protein AVDCRST_MAG74-1866 [uncultured Pyrinomonadaceae bacterium]|uniref:Uncharacterized protein n=1 Tax=uncultured Pyrinomonadaceae bacterium TaxID=2283094 RepID=A0A6J4P6T2_9BACT|nr:MAG: hypothetical protein AVDCRST_MAG74-1866 [uncultured Pyrinomonadaceae bacterium]
MIVKLITQFPILSTSKIRTKITARFKPRRRLFFQIRKYSLRQTSLRFLINPERQFFRCYPRRFFYTATKKCLSDCRFKISGNCEFNNLQTQFVFYFQGFPK